MSSRALRKLQKLQEQEHANDSPDELDDNLHSLHSFQKLQPKFNAFDLLESQDAEDKSDSETSIPEPIQTPEKPSTPSKPLDTKKRKKKKKGVKKAASPIESKPTAVPPAEESELDEIDLALKALSAKQPLRNDVAPLDSDQNSWRTEFGCPSEEPNELLAIDPRRLNAINEMKKLFGNVVLESTNEASSAGAGRRNRNQHLDLGRALMGRYNPVSRGQDLAGATLRKNVMMQAKDEWPRATSGGLGMEVVQSLHSDRAEYKLVHNKAYEDAQRQFDLCVESMEPERMIHHLQYNPYHISSLLQVSEIAKHQGDHAVSGDLLERALFTIGRSVHSSFSTRLKQGKSRLNFNIAANREFWLSGWRYIKNLEMKGTLKTAYEWAKLLLSLDPGDPYSINLIIDSLAIRGREQDHFIKLCSHPYFSKRWENFLNIQCSLALAYLLQGKPVECRSQLRKVMSHYPWVFCRLFQELNIEPIPKSIWAVQPPNETHCLFCELYIARAKDIWNTPEAISVLVEVADTLTKSKEEVQSPEITLDIARHVLLSDIPSVTTHLPHHFSAERMSASDPLPPGPQMDLSLNTHPVRIFDDARQLFGLPGEEAIGDVENEPEDSEDEEPPDRRPTDGDGDEVEDQADDDLSSPEEYLFNRGLQDLQDFLLVNGVDRGNWNADDDLNPVTVWVRRLRRLDREVWDSVIRDAAAELDSPLVADILLDELQLQEDVNR